MSIQHVLSIGDAGGKMSALCLVLIIYGCLSIRALVEVKHALRIINKHRVVVYCILHVSCTVTG